MRSIHSSSRRSGLALCLVSAGALLCAPSSPRAQPASPPPEDGAEKKNDPDGGDAPNKELARTHFLEAHRQHVNGDYAAAAENYLKAYAVYPKPAFVYNAAQVYRLDGNLAKALEHYKRYLELDPDGDGAPRAREFIPALEAKIAETSKPPRGVTGDDPLGKGGDGDAGDGDGDADGSQVDTSVLTSATAEPLPVVSRSSVAGIGRGRRIGGFAMVAVGAVLVGGGVGFGFHARSLSKQASDFNGPAGPELEDLYTRGEAADRNMVLMLSAGALTAAAGGVVYFLGMRAQGRAERDLELFVSPVGAGVTGRF